MSADRETIEKMITVLKGLSDNADKLSEGVTLNQAASQAKFDFLLDQQAQLSATVDKLTVSVDRLATRVDRTAESVTALLAVAEIRSQEIRELGDSLRSVDQRQRQRQSDELQLETRENLTALISTVERFISEGGKK